VKILAIKSRRLGDTVLWTSALQALCDHFTEAQLDIALPNEYEPLFRDAPHIRTRYLLTRDKNPDASRWRAERYDLVLVFHASPHTRRVAKSAKARRTLIHHHSRKALNFGSDTPIVSLGQPMSAVQRDLNLVRTLGWSGAAPPTKVRCPQAWTDRARERWFPKGTEENLVLFSPGASRLSKRWPLEHYAALAESVGPELTLGVIVPNLADFQSDRRSFERLKKRATFIVTPTLEEAVGALSLGKAFVGSDSGLKHLAVALGLSSVTLFGPESVGEWHPYDGKKHAALQNKVLCRTEDASNPHFAWCGVSICPLASHACMLLTPPLQVKAALLETL
jgi:ADP-heptose:LPS heptosyltransferase